MAIPLGQTSSLPVFGNGILRMVVSILKCEANPVALRAQAQTRSISYVKEADEVVQINYSFLYQDDDHDTKGL